MIVVALALAPARGIADCGIVANGSLRDAGVVFELINEARLRARRCGRKKFDAATRLKQASALEHAARAHARDMAAHDLLGHEGSDGNPRYSESGVARATDPDSEHAIYWVQVFAAPD